MKNIDVSRFASWFEVRRLGPEDAQEVFELMQDNPRFFEYSGGECSAEQVLRDMEALPPGKSAEDKYYLGYFAFGCLMAVLDFIDGYPDGDTAYIGFFMLHDVEQNRKIGRALMEKLFICCEELGYKRIMLGWEKENPQSSHFWQSCGFVPVKEVQQPHGTVVAAQRELSPVKSVPNFRSYLLAEAERCPAMGPRDALKLCYQAANGAEHGIKDRNAARKYLREELKRVEADDCRSLYTPISPGLCRVDLRAWKARGLKWQWLYAMFEDASGDGNMEEKLSAVENLAAEGKLPFTTEKWAAELDTWDGSAVSHSGGYRAAYVPAYRIVPGKFMACIEVLEKMAEYPEGCVVAIDGMSNSGKSSLADLLAQVTGAGVVHMDDLLSPGSAMQVTGKGWPGGNVNYRLFMDEILPKLSSERAFSHRYFKNHELCARSRRRVRRSPYRIVEGSYSQHVIFGDYADLRVFMCCDKATQYRRVVQRDGERMAPSYFRLWIPQEDEYFEFFKLRDKADIVIET